MRMVLWTSLAMAAFAANSVLNRMAVAGGMEPLLFAAVRLAAGAGMLLALVLARRVISGGVIWPGWAGRGAGVAGLLAYLIGFSMAYGSLGAGTGALILFGMVQTTMFSGAVLGREKMPAQRWAGAGLAFAGLVLLLAPGGGAVDPLGAGFMVAAGIGWGVYSLAGRGAQDALAATAANFGLAFAVVIMLMLGAALVLPPMVAPQDASALAIWLALISGAVTSGLGYALWYGILPVLGASRAAVAQLTVPVLAAAGGAAVLNEEIGWRFAVAATLVLGGVAWASVPR